MSTILWGTAGLIGWFIEITAYEFRYNLRIWYEMPKIWLFRLAIVLINSLACCFRSLRRFGNALTKTCPVLEVYYSYYATKAKS